MLFHSRCGPRHYKLSYSESVVYSEAFSLLMITVTLCLCLHRDHCLKKIRKPTCGLVLRRCVPCFLESQPQRSGWCSAVWTMQPPQRVGGDNLSLREGSWELSRRKAQELFLDILLANLQASSVVSADQCFLTCGHLMLVLPPFSGVL